MDVKTRTDLIEQYKDGYRVVAEALEGASDAELDARTAAGKWSAREIVHHLADSEMTSAIRLRLLLASDRPHIVGYDQEEFARRLHYDRPIEKSLDAFRAARASSAELLDLMTEVDWRREGTHSESGRYTAERWLELYAAHAHAHAQQIRIARDATKPR
jgi:hypothetical protein